MDIVEAVALALCANPEKVTLPSDYEAGYRHAELYEFAQYLERLQGYLERGEAVDSDHAVKLEQARHYLASIQQRLLTNVVLEIGTELANR